MITDELQAPLGHINVLCHNRKTPNMALRDASDSAEVKALAGKLVHLTVGAQGHRLEPATQAQAEAMWAKKRPAKGFSPPRNDRGGGTAAARRSSDGATSPSSGRRRRSSPSPPAACRRAPRRGGSRCRSGRTRASCAETGLEPKLTAMLADPAFRKDPEVRRTRLDAFRGEMTAAPVPADIVAD